MKAGKGDTICANIACGRTERLKEKEAVFNYIEDEKSKNVLVKCVLCEMCAKKMERARGKERERKRSRSSDRQRHDKDNHEERQHQRHREHASSRRSSTKRRRGNEEDSSEGRKSREDLDQYEGQKK